MLDWLVQKAVVPGARYAYHVHVPTQHVAHVVLRLRYDYAAVLTVDHTRPHPQPKEDRRKAYKCRKEDRRKAYKCKEGRSKEGL